MLLRIEANNSDQKKTRHRLSFLFLKENESVLKSIEKVNCEKTMLCSQNYVLSKTPTITNEVGLKRHNI
jgi:hypothetical protein